jgi:CRISPR-associated endonuclease/helicase Cas3
VLSENMGNHPTEEGPNPILCRVLQDHHLGNLLPQALREDLAAGESWRIRYKRKADVLNVETFLDFVRSLPGPRVVVLNTVQTAAVIALATRHAGDDVLHLSASLAPRDRHKVIAAVKRRLADPYDVNWTLVATSCVESGMDFSFRNAVRELSATTSAVQLGGRANRHGNPEWGASTVWVVFLADSRLTNNPSIGPAARVLDRLFREGAVDTQNASELCTSALRLEMSEADITAGSERLKRADAAGKYKETSHLYRVIDEDTVAAVVDSEIASRIEAGERLNPYDVLAASVRVPSHRVGKYKLLPLAGSDDLYKWTLAYDPGFLGYMDGVVGAH